MNGYIFGLTTVFLSCLLFAYFFAIQQTTDAQRSTSKSEASPTSESLGKKEKLQLTIDNSNLVCESQNRCPPNLKGNTNTANGDELICESQNRCPPDLKMAPIFTVGNNVYLVWWSKKTGNSEVMFRASTDGGKTFGNKINLSNTSNSDSFNANIAASGDKVFVTWWEHNSTSNEPVMRISDNRGQSFGTLIQLSKNGSLIPIS